MKMKNSLGQLANPVQIRVVRKDIAKINTAIVKKSVR
jgi:large subunit ribosomal protein L29